MARFPKPAEGSWTEHYPELGTEPVSYEDSISPGVLRARARGDLQAGVAQRRAGRAAAAQRAATSPRSSRSPTTSIIVVRDTHGEVRAFHNICRHRGNKLVWNDMPARGDERHLPAVHLQVPRLALRPRRHADLRPAGGRVLRPRQETTTASSRCTATSGRASSSSTSRREPEQSLRDFLGPMITALEGYPFDQMTERWLLPLRGQGELEALHGRLPGVLPRTRAAREAVAVEVLQRGAGGGLRGAALPDRRAAPARQHRRASARGSSIRSMRKPIEEICPQRAVRAVGRARPRREMPARASTRRLRPVGPRLVPALPELRDPDLGPGLVPHLPLLADVAQHATSSRARCTSSPAKTPRERIAQELAAVSFKEFGLQDANTLEATQTMLESRVVDRFPLGDQEVLCRHLHKETADVGRRLPEARRRGCDGDDRDAAGGVRRSRAVRATGACRPSAERYAKRLRQLDGRDAGVLRRHHAARRGGDRLSATSSRSTTCREDVAQPDAPAVLDDHGVVPRRVLAAAARPRLGRGRARLPRRARAVSDTTVLRAERWVDVDAGEVRSPAVIVVDGNRIVGGESRRAARPTRPRSTSATSRCCPA